MYRVPHARTAFTLGLWLCAATSACVGAIANEDKGSGVDGDPALPSNPGRGGVTTGGPGTGVVAPGVGAGGSGGTGAPLAPIAPPAACTAASARPDVGYLPVRRLTRQQYRRVTQELLKGDGIALERMPADERIGHFVSNAKSALGELQVEQYIDAAEELATAAVTRLPLLLPCDPAVMGPGPCARAFITKLGERAFRRPLSEAEVNDLAALHTDIAAKGTFADGVRVVLSAMLQSPYFLYRLELGEGSGDVVALGGRELAHRLAFFLWDGLPDEALLAEAAQGRLTTPAALTAQARRMLKDTRSRAVVKRFAAEWLDIDDLPTAGKDTKIFAGYNAALAEKMIGETERFFEHVLYAGDGRIETLLAAPYSLLDGPLYALYGLPPPAAGTPAWAKVTLNPAERAGLLTQASVLAVHAHPDQTSPVHRGALVRTDFLCQNLTPPPPEVDDTPPKLEAGLTTRQRLERKTAPAECAGCHRLINPVGFGLENYDGIGRFRTMEEKRLVDASGEMIATRDIDGRFTGGLELARKLAGSGEVRDCVAAQWFRYALGRLEAPQDECSLATLRTTLHNAQGDVRELIVAVTGTDAFRMRRVREP